MRKTALLLLVVLACAGCRGNRELELRYEAERLRWRIDQQETRRSLSSPRRDEVVSLRRMHEEVVSLRRMHEEVHRRFGASAPPTGTMLSNPDTVRRLRIAGASSLYGADLAAAFHPSSETLEEYERIASIYEFDRELGYRALYGKARLLEKLGRPAEALEVDLVLLQRYPPLPARRDDAPLPFANPILLDLEVHTLAVAKFLGPETFAELYGKMLVPLRERVHEWQNTMLERDLSRHLARALFVAEEWDEGLRLLARARDLAPSKEIQIEDELEISEVLWLGKGDLAAAEETLGRAIEAGKGSALEPDARMDLAKILLQQKKYAASLQQLDELLRLRPRFLEGLKGEAFYWKGMVLVGLEQWADALPRLESVTEVDTEGSWAIEARVEIMNRVRELQFENGEQAARGAVQVAQRVRASEESREPPFGWDGFWWRPQEEDKWQRCVDGLREIARLFPESDFAPTANEQALRLEKERIFHPMSEDSSAVKLPSSAAEIDVGRETS